MSRPTVLGLDLPSQLARSLRARAESTGFAFIAGAREIVSALPAEPFALCCLGLMGLDDAVETVKSLRKFLGTTPLVVCATGLSTDVVLQLARLGVRDIVDWPGTADAVAARVMSSAIEPCSQTTASEIVGSSPAMQGLRHEVEAAARTASTVLVTGPTGSGKGLVARSIHRASSRRDRPFVTVDCGAIAPSLVESELFGHERGAFTGASERRIGRLELAADGVVFLDEIGDMEPRTQRTLLRVLQERSFERVGGTRSLVLGARVIAATHRDLARAVEHGQFRIDLLYRLNVVHVAVPALESHREDIPALVERGVREISQRLEIDVPAIDDELLVGLMPHDWPGNVRELMHTLERLLVRVHTGGGGRLRFDPRTDTGVFSRAVEAPPRHADRVRDRSATDLAAERERLSAALRKHRGNVSKAARQLGLARSTLRYRLNRLVVPMPPEQDD